MSLNVRADKQIKSFLKIISVLVSIGFCTQSIRIMEYTQKVKFKYRNINNSTIYINAKNKV